MGTVCGTPVRRLPLAQLTVYAVQFQHEADPAPWGWIGRP